MQTTDPFVIVVELVSLGNDASNEVVHPVYVTMVVNVESTVMGNLNAYVLELALLGLIVVHQYAPQTIAWIGVVAWLTVIARVVNAVELDLPVKDAKPQYAQIQFVRMVVGALWAPMINLSVIVLAPDSVDLTVVIQYVVRVIVKMEVDV